METNNLPPLGEDPVLRKLSAGSIDKADLIREEDRYRELVSTFADLIREDVKAQLSSAPAKEVSDQFVQAAQALLGQQPVADSSEAQQAERIRSELAAELQAGLGKPDDEEIEEHVIELSQCLVSNWLTVLQKTLDQRHGTERSIELIKDALPGDIYARSLLFHGLSLFALDNRLLAERFTTFLGKLQDAELDKVSRFKRLRDWALQKWWPTFSIIPLAPDLTLISGSKGKWYVTVSKADAEEAVRQLRIAPSRDSVSNPVIDGLAAPRIDCVPSVVEGALGTGYRALWDYATVLALIRRTMIESPETDVLVLREWKSNFALQLGTEVAEKVAEEVAEVIDAAVGRNRLSPAEVHARVQEQVLKICELLDKDPQYAEVPKLEACQVVLGAVSMAIAVRAKPKETKAGMTDALGAPPQGRPSTPKERLVVDLARDMVIWVLQMDRVNASITALSKV